MSTAAEQSDYISNVRKLGHQFWDAYTGILAMQAEWNAQNYGQTLANGTDANAGITAAQIGSVVFDTMNAVKTVMDAGNATNITNIL